MGRGTGDRPRPPLRSGPRGLRRRRRWGQFQYAPGGDDERAASAPADRAAAEQQIRQNWQKFFDPATSTKDKQAVLENGEQMGPMLHAYSGDQRGGQVAAKVGKVEFTSPTEATVTYTLTLNGATALPNASGKAVLQNGTWKVSVTALCALVRLSGDGSSSVPGC